MKDDCIEETQLVRQIVAGEESAVERFYALYADALYAFIYHHVGNKEEAEDIWQESLLVAIRGIERFQGQSRLYTWLCGIARHKIADTFRRRNKPVEDIHPTPVESMTGLWDGAPLPEACVQERSTRLLVLDTLQQLPQDYRTALIARYADEKEVGEVARMLGRSYKATESLLARARGAFQALLHRMVQDG